MNLKIKGFRDADLKQWEHTRFIAFTMAKPYLKNKGLTLQRFLPLPTDKDNPKGLEIDPAMFKPQGAFAIGAALVCGILAALYIVFW